MIESLPITYEPIDRLIIIQELVSTRHYRKYLEIGCDRDSVFTHLSCEHKVGVDPARGGNMRMTSDEYFDQYQDRFDIIFIDGLHYYHQVQKDLANSLNRLEPGGIILIHDCLPTSPLEAVVPIPQPLHTAWTGDVWRISFDLMARDDIKYDILNSPYGLGVVTVGHQQPLNLGNQSQWSFYAENWNQLPIRSCREALLNKFSNIIAKV